MKEFLERQKAAFMISGVDTPANRAQDELILLVSCALGSLPESKASGPAALMPSTIHREMVEGEAAEKGFFVMTNSLSFERRDLALDKYHLSALTGHQVLSSGTEEKVESLLRKISTGPETSD